MSRAARRRAPGLSPGTTIAGRYRLEAQLGEGGMAEVFRAEDLATRQRVAVKVLHTDVASNPEAVERIRREGQILSELDNPAIVSVETFGELEDGTVFVVMELLEGETLGQRMRRGRLEPAELAPIVTGTSAGLHAAHSRGIVHRDLKPDNIFLCKAEDGLQVKLLDFGISKIRGRDKLTQTGEILGTPRYMSPEQLAADADIDARVDVYALGVILYEALAETPPFLATTPTDLIIAILNGKVAPLRSVRPDVPAEVEAVVMRAMSKARAARYDTAMALAEAYVDAVGGPSKARQPHRHVATRALGGMRSAAEVQPLVSARSSALMRDGEPGGSLRIGTFSGVDERVPESDARIVPPTRESPLWVPEDVAGEMSSHPFGTPAVPSGPHPRRRIAPTEIMDLKSSSPPVSSSPELRASPLGRRRGGGVSKALLVAGALIAGAGSAAAVIAILHWLESSARLDGSEAVPGTVPEPSASREVPSPPESNPPAASEDEGASEGGEAGDAPAAATGDPDEMDPQRGGGDDVRPVPPAVGAARSEARSSARRAQETRRRRSNRTGSDNDPLDAIRTAQSALRGGDPDRCVTLLSEAIRSGAPAIALRRRADCLEAAGRRAEAVRDYQRFCRLVPDHPSISEVRPLLEAWGRTCP